jgi:Core-2/I-Branching enzyme
MKIAYLVFAYKNPQLLKKLIGQLSSEDCGFFIHIDQKSDISQFSGISGPNIFFSEKRIPVHWAEFSGIRAILLLIQQALQAPEHYQYFCLLSGSEYPIRSHTYIQKFLEDNRGFEFINTARMPAPGKPISRLNTLRYPSTKPVRRFAMRLLAKVGMARRDYRKYLGHLKPYSGITWWTLTRDACQYILEFVTQNPHVSDYFEEVFAPEETFFHTILGNSEFQSRIRRNLLYEDWSCGGGHPAMITPQHIEFFESSEKVSVDTLYGPGELLFARKFSDDTTHLLQRIDDMIDRKEQRTQRSLAVLSARRRTDGSD